MLLRTLYICKHPYIGPYTFSVGGLDHPTSVLLFLSRCPPGFYTAPVSQRLWRGALGCIRNRKTDEKIVQNRKTANKFAQNRKPHTSSKPIRYTNPNFIKVFFVSMFSHHFPKLQISNPTEVLVLSDIRPY